MSLPEWQALTTEHSDTTGPVWYWLSGWSFAPGVFEALVHQLPGQHLALNWHAASGSFDAFASRLAATAEPDAIWIGWSLGGALAMRAAVTAKARTVVTLATGQRFCKPAPDSNWGMAADVFAAFQDGLQQQPEKTLKRFLGLCAQGSNERKALMQALASHQLNPAELDLAHSLAWLGDYDLGTDQQALTAAGIPQQHLYASADSLSPGGLTPATTLGHSHALLLESATTPQLLALLQTLSGQDVTPS